MEIEFGKTTFQLEHDEVKKLETILFYVQYYGRDQGHLGPECSDFARDLSLKLAGKELAAAAEA